MPAYFIADVDVLDPQVFERYRTAAAASVAQYGGKYVVRGGAPEVIEGDWRPHGLIALEFESADAIKRWYESPEYRAAKQLRERSAKMNAVLAQGVELMTGYERAREG